MVLGDIFFLKDIFSLFAQIIFVNLLKCKFLLNVICGYPCFIKVSLATIGVCVWGASATVGALFYFKQFYRGIFMKRFLWLLILSLIAVFCAVSFTACEEDNGANLPTDTPTHTHAFVDFTVNPTCTIGGYTLHKCTCGVEYKDNYTTAIAHDYQAETTLPTCTEQGYTTYTCIRCGNNYVNDYAAALGHDYNATITEPTCTEQGYTTYTCTRCGNTYKSDYIEATGHEYINGTCVNCKAEKPILVSFYIDGELYETVTTTKNQGYRIVEPDRPEDITVNPDLGKYFYGWFVDNKYQKPLKESDVFITNSKVYAKWINIDTDDFEYTVSKGKATIIGFKNETATIVVIPAYINTFPVITIGYKTKTSDGANYYPNGAFLGKTMIREVIICEGIQVIDETAFLGCDSMEKIILPNSLITINDRAFFNCESLKTVVIPNSVTSIERMAFSRCSSLESVTIGDDVTSIGDYAFEYCSCLTSITIPSSVANIGTRVFEGCKSLDSINVDEHNMNYKSIDGNLYSKDGKIFIQYAIGKMETEFAVPTTVTTIVSYSFYLSKITRIQIPVSVEIIEAHAFSATGNDNNSNLIEAVFENNGNWKLTAYTLPDGIKIQYIYSGGLQDESIAATYLKSTYYYYKWEYMG